MKIVVSKKNLYLACVGLLFTMHLKTQELFYAATEKTTTSYFKSVEPLSGLTTKFNYGVPETLYSALDTTITAIKPKPTAGFFPTIETMKQVNSNLRPQTACKGVSGNQLINPSFELPEQPRAGNNFFEWPINGWNGEGAEPNVVRCDGVVSTGGPRNAQEGFQYLDIAGPNADFYQEFDFQCNTKVFFSGYFSVRDGQTSTGKIDIVRVNSDNTTDIVTSSNELNMPSTAEIWYLASGSAVLPKGRYRFQISMGHNTNFDNACFSFDYPNIETGSYDPLCESSSSITLTGTPTDNNGSWEGIGISDNGDGTASFNPSGLGGTAVTATYSHFNTSGFGCSQSTNITVNPVIIPIFTQVAAICNGGTLDALPTSSDNNITGTWSPAMDNTLTTTYTFTPDASETCEANETMTITVNPLITPTFTQVAAICNGGTLDALPTSSDKNITGTWSPAMDNTLTTTYIFTPDTTQPGQACAVTETMTITVNPLITPTFTQVAAICNGGTLDALPTSSDNNITGTWSPAMDNTLTTTYTFTPDASETCAVNETMTITVNPLITPTFTQVAAICNGAVLDALPTSSDNNITGTWSPAMDNTLTTIYTFTPDASETCATPVDMEITVNSLITPTFTQVAAICIGGTLDALPTSSDNNITGTWSPAMNNTETTTYTFTADTTQPSGQVCAVNETMTIIVNPITPTFSQVDPICNGAVLAALTPTSNNNITGTWSPAMDNTLTTTYTFTPDTTQPDQACAINETMTIKVNSLTIPTFTQVAPICNGAVLDPLTPTSNNNITGTWSPAINNTETTTYTFTPDTTKPGQACAVNQKMEITVNPLVTPTFTQVAAICNGAILAALPTTSNNGVTGTWSPAMDNTLTTTYTFTPDTSETCADLLTLEIVVNNIVNSINSIKVKVNLVSSSFDDNQSIEVIASGGTAPYEYRLENGPWQDSPIFNYRTDSFYVVFVREKTACNNQPATSLQVINHPVFFTPNNDGFNDIWNIKGLEVQPEAQITIYDRYGKIITIYKPTSPGWDGLYNGKKMPSNDYWFTIEYLDTENIPKVFRSHFSLIR